MTTAETAKPQVIDSEKKKELWRSTPETERIVRALTNVNVGNTISYQALGALIKLADIREKLSVIQSARNIAVREFGIVFGCVENVGFKRLTDSEIANLGAFTIGHIRRVSRSTVKRISCAKYEGLSNEDKIKSNTSISFLGALHQMSHRARQLRLEDKVKECGTQLKLADTMKLFSNGREVKTDCG